ncbi:MAG: MFS transporter [Proteobacteria bacterium]|nr:MFS transporter [Pseudomonadota bacterium]
MDRARKDRLLAIVLSFLALGFLVLGILPYLPQGLRLPLFFGAGAWAGIGWGVAMPVFNGLMFDISDPRFKSLNTNLGMQMFQAGFFVGPFLGSALVGSAGFGPVFYLSALLSLTGACLMILFKRRAS